MLHFPSCISLTGSPTCYSRAELLAMYERVILTDIEFSDSQNLDQALWKNVFYQVIERFRQMMKDSPTDTPPYVRNMLFTVLDEVWLHARMTRTQTYTLQTHTYCTHTHNSLSLPSCVNDFLI